MKNDNYNIVVIIIVVSILSVISFYFFLNPRYLKIYLIFITALWILTLGFWPWWKTKKSKLRIRRNNPNQTELVSIEIKIDAETEDENMGSFEIRENPQAKEVPYRD